MGGQARRARSAARSFRPRPCEPAGSSAVRRASGVRGCGRRRRSIASPLSRRSRRETLGPDWRAWPEPLRAGEAKAVDAAIARDERAFEFTLFCQWLADRQLARASAQARKGGLEIGFYRDLAVGAAPDGAEAWAHAGELAQGVSVGAPPDPFSTQGQNWNLPAPNPLHRRAARLDNISAVYAANMRHAGMLRIDHAMGLQRLFLIPEGAKPAEGAYLAYPLDDLIGHIALESQRAQMHGGRRGSRHGAGRISQPADAGQHPGHAGASGSSARALNSCRPQPIRRCRSPASRRTISRRSPAGGAAPTSPSASRSGSLPSRAAGEAIAARREEKRGLVAALVSAGLLSSSPAEDAPLDDATAAAVHALIGGAGSVLAHAQFDDLVGETVATNLPGTDRERPNWRLKLSPDVASAFAGARARDILAALAKGRV